jgi:phosphatidylglycerophosphatase C
MSLSDLHQKVFDRFLRGRSLEALEVHVESFVEEYLSKSLYMPAVECLKRAQHLGHYTLILSNSPSFLVKAVSQFLGVHEWKATEYAVDQERKLCNISSIMQGEDKAKWLEKVARRLKVHKDAVTAYSDSHLDLPFLRAAGRAIAVNPNRKLRQYSRKHQWSVL